MLPGDLFRGTALGQISSDPPQAQGQRPERLPGTEPHGNLLRHVPAGVINQPIHSLLVLDVDAAADLCISGSRCID
jgi:hypothetical protein